MIFLATCKNPNEKKLQMILILNTTRILDDLNFQSM